MMYNSPCVLTHPSGPEEAHSASLSTRSCTERRQEAFCLANPHTLKNSICNIKNSMCVINYFYAVPLCVTPATDKYTFTSMPHYTHTTQQPEQRSISTPGPPWLLLWQAPYDMKEIQLIHAVLYPHPQKAIIPLPLICSACVCLYVSMWEKKIKGGLRERGTASRWLIKIEPAWK